MRKIKVYANPNDWRAYLATPHHKILSLFAEDDSSKEPIYLLPDLSPDTGLPNGSIFTTNGFLYPYAVGRDIGCGYAYGILHKATVNAESPHIILRKVFARLVVYWTQIFSVRSSLRISHLRLLL